MFFGLFNNLLLFADHHVPTSKVHRGFSKPAAVMFHGILFHRIYTCPRFLKTVGFFHGFFRGAFLKHRCYFFEDRNGNFAVFLPPKKEWTYATQHETRPSFYVEPGSAKGLLIGTKMGRNPKESSFPSTSFQGQTLSFR